MRKLIINLKIWLSRSSSYISMANSGMILFILLQNLNISLKQWAIPLYLLFMSLLVLVGYIEDRMGFFRAEIESRNDRNPYMSRILNKLDEIDNRIQKIEREQK